MATTKKISTQNKIDMSDVMSISEKTPHIDLQKTSEGTVHIEDTALINVKSNVFGRLNFIDPVTKEKICWVRCGEVLQLPLSMLRNMKNRAVKFFTNQLVIITGFADGNADKYEVADIYKALYITQYYKNILDPTNYEEICSWTPDVIREKAAMFGKGVKTKLIVALNTYIEKGVLDSLKAIKTFEEVLGCELKRPE